MKITANMVTLGRIVLLPIPIALILHGDPSSLWVAFVIAVLLGMTDFVDGYMARREGGTLLGSLLDPVADKIFIAALMLPVVAMGDCPGWAGGALFTRELLITALRTSMAVRKEPLKTSQLGKLKTVAQMGGLGTYFLTITVPSPWVFVVHGGGTIGLTILAVVIGMRARAWPPLWAIGGAALWAMVFVLTYFLAPHDSAYWQFIVMVSLSWVSGFDYIVGAWKALRRSGLRRTDVVRLFWSVAHGILVVPVIADHPNTVLPLLLALSAELCLGGVDNIVAAEQGREARASFGWTSLLAVGVFAASRAEPLLGTHTNAVVLGLSIALAVASSLSAVVAFRRERAVFAATAM